MKIPILSTAFGAYILSMLLLVPAVTSALAPAHGPAALQTNNPVIITELQTGSSATGKSDEFIELYNAGDVSVDISGWQLRYLNASSGTQTTTVATVIPASGEASRMLAPGAYYVVHTASVLVASGIPGQTYEAKLSNAEKAVGLFKPNLEICTYEVQDAVGWGVSSKVETKGLPVPTPDKNAERHLQRYRDTGGYYIDTNVTFYDIALSVASPTIGATPGSPNAVSKDTSDNPIIYTQLPDYSDIAVAGCVVPAEEEPGDSEPPVTISPVVEPPIVETDVPETPEVPASAVAPPTTNLGLLSLQLTEILPNPASPQTDAADEFIELYNPNDQRFDLSGYVLEIGATTKRRYTFPQGAGIDSKQFQAFFSAETGLALSNSGSQVSLVDPQGNIIAEADPYATAKEGTSWVRSNGTWAWTTTPTPNAANTVTLAAASAAKKGSSAAAAAKTTKAASTAKATAAKPAKSTTATTSAPATSMASLSPDRPIHASILVLVGVFAVLYGLYEYRHDLANYIYRIRNYRTARREARGKA